MSKFKKYFQLDLIDLLLIVGSVIFLSYYISTVNALLGSDTSAKDIPLAYIIIGSSISAAILGLGLALKNKCYHTPFGRTRPPRNGITINSGTNSGGGMSPSSDGTYSDGSVYNYNSSSTYVGSDPQYTGQHPSNIPPGKIIFFTIANNEVDKVLYVSP